MTKPPTNAPTSGADFRRRLGYYLTGLAIGCFMAGAIYYARKAQFRREEAARQAAELQAQPLQRPRQHLPRQKVPDSPSNPPPRARYTLP